MTGFHQPKQQGHPRQPLSSPSSVPRKSLSQVFVPLQKLKTSCQVTVLSRTPPTTHGWASTYLWDRPQLLHQEQEKLLRTSQKAQLGLSWSRSNICWRKPPLILNTPSPTILVLQKVFHRSYSVIAWNMSSFMLKENPPSFQSNLRLLKWNSPCFQPRHHLPAAPGIHKEYHSSWWTRDLNAVGLFNCQVNSPVPKRMALQV